VLIKADIIGALLGKIGDGFAAGSIGQCWNCPAADAETARLAGFASPCSPDAYADFRPDFVGLEALYDAALTTGRFVRPYRLGWDEHYRDCAWPLPECRVNEWGCLVDVEQTRPLVIPEGDILPFGAYEQCGPIALDIAVSWFRELNRRGLRAYHVDTGRCLDHWCGTGKMRAYGYSKVEAHAKHLLMKGFPDFVTWCRAKKNRMFD
ncbi:MAG: hypothetical protein LBC55_06820, partial [Desulfovibrio sp.]|nr:hypothetical protein [Desulfovibrio sp.]